MMRRNFSYPKYKTNSNSRSSELYLDCIIRQRFFGERRRVVNGISCFTTRFSSGQSKMRPTVRSEAQVIFLSSHESILTSVCQFTERISVQSSNPSDHFLPTLHSSIRHLLLNHSGSPSPSRPGSQTLCTAVATAVAPLNGAAIGKRTQATSRNGTLQGVSGFIGMSCL